MSFAWFLLFAVTLASGVVGCLSAALACFSESWLDSGDGWLFWVTWREDPGGRRLLLAAGAAALLLVSAAGASRFRFLRPADWIVSLLGRPFPAAAALLLAITPHIVVTVAGPSAEGKPKVLIVLLDTVRLDHVGWGGSARDTTPRLDALAARGIAFRQAVSSSSWTKPAVASLLTGLVPSRHLAIGSPTLLYYPNLQGDRRTLAEAFAREGYFTAAVSSNPNISPRFGFQQGFHAFHHNSSDSADQLIAIGEEFLEEAGDRPFFLYLHLNDAHYPYRAPEPYLGLFSDPSDRVRLNGDAKNLFRRGESDWGESEIRGLRDAYDEEIRYLDDCVGAFVERMLEQHEDLLVVILSDHGEEFFEHGDIGHGHTLNDELLLVPFQIAWGSAIDLEPGIVDSQVSTLDLLPTLLEIADIEWPDGAARLDGRSLLPVLEGQESDRPAYSETEARGSQRSGLTGPLRSWRTPATKLVLTDPLQKKAGRFWLYDLAADPGETVNLAAERPELREEYLQAVMASGWLLPKQAFRSETALMDESVLNELAELGYVDDLEETEAGAEPQFNAGAVPWWQAPPTEDG